MPLTIRRGLMTQSVRRVWMCPPLVRVVGVTDMFRHDFDEPIWVAVLATVGLLLRVRDSDYRHNERQQN